ELAEALAAFPGGALLVSHDRELIEAACNRFWALNDGLLQEWPDADSAYAALFTAPASPPERTVPASGAPAPAEPGGEEA
ncbi:hypothetical protein VL02_22325, partial [Chromobacterium violaceum]